MPAPPDLPPAPLPPPAEAGAPAPGSWRARTFASFASANYRWFFLGQGVSLVGSWIRSAAQGWLVYLLTGSLVDLGTVAALSQAPLVLSPLAGAVADRMDKRRLLVGLALAAMALSLVLAALTWSGAVRPWHVMAVAGFAGLEMAFEIPVRQSYVVEMVGRRLLHNAVALNSAMFNAARMVGPAVAGLLMGAFTAAAPAPGVSVPRDAALRGIALCFLVDGLSFLAVIAALWRIRSLAVERQSEEGGWRGRLLAGFAYVRGNRRARVLLTLLGISTVFGWSYLALMPAHARDALGLDAAGYGRLLSANGVGAALGALWVAGRPEAPDRRAIRRRVFGALGLFAAMVIVFSRMESPLAAGAALAGAGFGAIAFVSTSNTLIQVAVPHHLRGRVMGIWALVFGGCMPLGSYLIGHLADAVGTPAAVAVSGATCLLLSGLAWLRLPPVPISEGAREGA